MSKFTTSLSTGLLIGSIVCLAIAANGVYQKSREKSVFKSTAINGKFVLLEGKQGFMVIKRK